MIVLLVEDKKEIRKQLLDTWLPKIGIELTVAEDTDTAQKYLERNQFEAILIDLNLADEDGEFSGIPFGANVRSSYEELLIVMYSAHIEDGRESSFKHIDDCKNAGADHVLARSYLTTKPAVTIKKKLEELHEKRLAKLRDNVKVTYDDTLKIRAVIERLGSVSVLKAILQKVVPNASEYKVQVLSEGYSGAILLRTTSEKVANTGATARNIVKIDKSDFSLARELKSKPFQGTHLDSVSVAPRADHVVRVQEWSAFSVRDVGDSISLEWFLLKQRSSTKTIRLVDGYVDTLLKENAVQSTEQRVGDDSLAFDLRYTFLQEVVNAIDSVDMFCEVLPKSKVWRESALHLRKFVEGMVSGYYGMAGQAIHVAPLHGDFHCRNILLTKGDFRPVVIDFGKSAIYPRLFDYSSLEADVIIRVLDSDVGKFWEPAQVSVWWESLGRAFPLGDKSVDGKSLICHLRNKIHHSLQNELVSVTKREYADALIFQILRYLRFSNISIAKKAMCVRWASQLVKSIGM